MKKVLFVAVLACVCAALWADPDVYVAGNDTGACYWKNGRRVALSRGKNTSLAVSITVSGGIVYAAGWEEQIDGTRIACYWKNGERTALTRTDGYATGIAVAASGVYVAGVIGVRGGDGYSSGDAACYWKNGERVLLTSGRTWDYANAIAVSGNDVYVAGHEDKTACYWKNGRQIALSSGRTYAEATGIAVSGGNVYVSGRETSSYGRAVACYWKNGEQIALSSKWAPYSTATCIAVSGGDVYVGGIETVDDGVSTILPGGGRAVLAGGGYLSATACYWKNGEKVVLSAPEWGYGEVYSIAVSGTNVYAAGHVVNPFGNPPALPGDS